MTQLNINKMLQRKKNPTQFNTNKTMLKHKIKSKPSSYLLVINMENVQECFWGLLGYVLGPQTNHQNP